VLVNYFVYVQCFTAIMCKFAILSLSLLFSVSSIRHAELCSVCKSQNISQNLRNFAYWLSVSLLYESDLISEICVGFVQPQC